ncbi:MAG: DUF2156 domain-containing protein [Candidatus Thermoplasmatota archaeon]
MQNKSNNNEDNTRLNYLKKYGKCSLSYLTLSKDIQSYHDSWEGYIAYKILLKSAIVLGDPIVSNDHIQLAVRRFKEDLHSKGIPICLFCSTNNTLHTLKKEGFKSIYIGREAIIDLKKFNLSGKKRASIRSSIHHAERNNLTVEEYKYNINRSSNIESEIRHISEEWKRIRRMPELTFAFGHVDFDNYKDIRYFICRHQNRMIGFISLYPIYASNSSFFT